MSIDPAIAARKQALTALLACIAQRDLKPAELGELPGLSRSRLDRLLEGDARAFNIDTLIRLAARLDMRASVLLTRLPREG